MILPDANLLLYAYDSTSPFHDKARLWWEESLSGAERVGLCAMVVFAFIRISTHPRVYSNPIPVRLASEHVESWLKRKACRFIPMETIDVVQAMALLKTIGVGGGLTTDALIAAISHRLGATIYSADIDFLRFTDLKVRNPLKAPRDR